MSESCSVFVSDGLLLQYTDKFFNFGLFFALVPNPAYEAGAAALGCVRPRCVCKFIPAEFSRFDSLSGGKDSPGNRSTLVASADRGTSCVRVGGESRFFAHLLRAVRDKQKASLRKGTVGRTKKVTSADFGKDDIIENELLKVRIGACDGVVSGHFVLTTRRQIKMPDGSHTTVRLPDSAPATEVTSAASFSRAPLICPAGVGEMLLEAQVRSRSLPFRCASRVRFLSASCDT